MLRIQKILEMCPTIIIALPNYQEVHISSKGKIKVSDKKKVNVTKLPVPVSFTKTEDKIQDEVAICLKKEIEEEVILPEAYKGLRDLQKKRFEYNLLHSNEIWDLIFPYITGVDWLSRDKFSHLASLAAPTITANILQCDSSIAEKIESSLALGFPKQQLSLIKRDHKASEALVFILLFGKAKDLKFILDHNSDLL